MIDIALQAIKEADELGALRSPHTLGLSGLSGERLIGSLQRLAHAYSRIADVCYAEIGVFQGLTLLSVASATTGLPCYGIDNFSQFDSQGKNESLVRDRAQRLGISNAHLVNADFEAAFARFFEHSHGRKIGVYFVDGPHDYRSQMTCLLFAKPLLHDEAVIVIDDSNYQHVRQANHDFLRSHPEFKLIFEAYTGKHPVHMSREEEQAARAGWWNGVNILIRDPHDRLDRILPNTAPAGTCFGNDHIVHAHRYGELAAVALRLFGGFDNWWRLPTVLAGIYRHYRRFTDRRGATFLDTNTFSADLPTHRFAELQR